MSGFLATTVVIALREIRRQLLRSFLTTLGVIIGVAAVVTMVTLGDGATAAVREQISKLGSQILLVRPGQASGRAGSQANLFQDADVEAIRSQVEGVRSLAPQAQVSATAIRNASNWQTNVNGTTLDFFTTQPWELDSGRLFTPEEESAGKAVCLVGATVRRKLFAGEDPIGQQLRIRDISCDVIGSLTERGEAGYQDQDDVIVMPIKTVQRRLTGNRGIRIILAAVDAGYDLDDVQAGIARVLRERRGIAPGELDDFNIIDTRQVLETLSGTTRILTLVMAAVAAVSLLVGGIGIMNIMLVSVTERTREIGTRLAIGALGREVMLQFLVEAVTLSCVGGVLGLALALVASALIARSIGIPFLFNPEINLLAFLFSAAIGVLFGFLPARRAASLNPIDALRHE